MTASDYLVLTVALLGLADTLTELWTGRSLMERVCDRGERRKS